ncbi:MAG: RlmE family RNA methyltransferase [Enterobacterales bacterium]
MNIKHYYKYINKNSNSKLRDPYFYAAKRNKLRSRAWFKLNEIQNKYNIIKPNMTVVDLGSYPGSWSQYVSQIISKNNGKIISCDKFLMKPIKNVDFFQGDLNNKIFVKKLYKKVGKYKSNLVLSDMSPNISGISSIDIPKSINLAKLALNICKYILDTNGNFLVKVFYGKHIDEYLKKISLIFKKIYIKKPEASKKKSREVYILAINKIISKLF